MKKIRRLRGPLWLVGSGLLLVAPLLAGPSVWEQVRDPGAKRRAELLARADQKREPMDATFESPAIRMQLHRAAATWLDLASVETLGDIDLLYLFGECLAAAGPAYHARAKAVLQRALQQAPDDPAAPQAWLALGRVAASLEDYALQYAALEQVLHSEWRHSVRVEVLLDQGLGSMADANLLRAIERLQGAEVEATMARQWALAQWALGVAMDRALLGPQAAALAQAASLAVFGSSGRDDVLSLPDIELWSPGEPFYYRALARMGRARVAAEQDRVRTYQEAKFFWLRYLDATIASPIWHRRVQQHLEMIALETTELDTGEEDLDALVAAPVELDVPDAGFEPLWPEELERGPGFWGDAGVNP